MKQFKVFYSWQSDLPKNKNRYFIDSCIKEAIKNCNKEIEGTEILADRDTEGLTGSPDIAQSIFDKINECDLFIADVSIVNPQTITDNSVKDRNSNDYAINNEPEKKKRYTPNPNVLIELGYAVHCLGWERIICIINLDYGDIDKLPFDLKQHRVTQYSFNNNDKNSIKKHLCGIITESILEFSNKPRNKKKAYHIVGTYNPNNKTIDTDLVAYNIRNNCWVDEQFTKYKEDCLKLIKSIKTYKIPFVNQKEQENLLESELVTSEWLKKFSTSFGIGSHYEAINYFINDDKRNSIIELSEKYLKLAANQFDDEFFNLDNLKTQTSAIPNPITGSSEPYREGTDEEKEKDKAIHLLLETLSNMQLLDFYLQTFDDILLFPLAIENNSSEKDEDIEISVTIEGNCKIVVPSVNFINPQIREQAIDVYTNGFPKHLLVFQNDSEIKYEDDSYLNYNPDEPFYGSVIPNLNLGVGEEEYGKAMEYYIATPEKNNGYQFAIDSLRSSEKKWVGKIIALRKPTDEEAHVKMTYGLLSNNTSGDVEGEIEYKGEAR